MIACIVADKLLESAKHADLSFCTTNTTTAISVKTAVVRSARIAGRITIRRLARFALIAAHRRVNTFVQPMKMKVNGFAVYAAVIIINAYIAMAFLMLRGEVRFLTADAPGAEDSRPNVVL